VDEAAAESYALAYAEGKDAIATSFLGGQALRSGALRPWSWTAIVLFALLGLGALAMLWPRSWEFEADPRDIIATHVEAADPVALHVIHRDVALHRADVLEENGRRFDRLIWLFRGSGVLLIFEIGAWGADLATRVD
jgi:hypothetical protein